MQHGKGREVKRKNSTGSQGGGKLAAFGNGSQPGVRILWDEASPEAIAAVVCAMSRIGGAILFGGSRDQGALLVTLHLDDDRKNIWIAGGEDVDGKLFEIFQKLEALE